MPSGARCSRQIEPADFAERYQGIKTHGYSHQYSHQKNSDLMQTSTRRKVNFDPLVVNPSTALATGLSNHVRSYSWARLSE